MAVASAGPYANHFLLAPDRQQNGACKRFNGTLKTMIRSMLDRFPDSWDTALPRVLFAYREVPVETLGCSSFELMFGRTVPGPLQLVKSAWLQETDMSSPKQNVVEFILNTPERLRHALDLANTHAAQERSKAKVWYDRRARLRTFQPGDKVLVLMPMPGKPLHAKYHVPYTVEQLSLVDYYVICTPDRRKTKRVCHVNLLKPYHEREPGLDPAGVSIPADVLVQSPVSEEMECSAPTSLPTSVSRVETLSQEDGQLTSTQTEDLTALLDEFGDVFFGYARQDHPWGTPHRVKAGY